MNELIAERPPAGQFEQQRNDLLLLVEYLDCVASMELPHRMLAVVWEAADIARTIASPGRRERSSWDWAHRFVDLPPLFVSNPPAQLLHIQERMAGLLERRDR